MKLSLRRVRPLLLLQIPRHAAGSQASPGPAWVQMQTPTFGGRLGMCFCCAAMS